MKKFKVLLYCTKKGGDLVYFGYGNREYRCMTKKNQDYIFNVEGFNPNDISHCLNGTIPCECEIEVEELPANNYIYNVYWKYETFNVKERELLARSCLDYEQLLNYLRGYNGYALHISNLKVFDKPRYLDEYYNYDSEGLPYKITKAPQNMCKAHKPNFLEIEHYVLISVQPQWLCEILNGEKTIEVRKQVLNCMKGDD